MGTSSFERGIISRRDFVRGGLTSAAAAGIMAFATRGQDTGLDPMAAVLGTGIAYAREAYVLGDDEYIFDVVGVDEIGVFVVDPTKTDEKGDPVGVPNAIVILTSTDDTSLPQIQERTGDDGKCILNINGFCKKDEEGKPEDGIFEANVSVTITSDDESICEYVIPSTLVIGATGYRFAVEPYDGKPYLLGASFNKQDILHEVKSFLRSPYNQYEYEICVRIKGVAGTTPVSLTFYRASDTERLKPLIGSPMNKDAKLDDTGSYAEVIFAANYLYAGDDECLPADDITIVVGVGDSFSSEISMKVVDAPTDAYSYEGPISILACLPNTLFTFSLPLGDDTKSYGFFTKMDVSLVCPTTPVHFYVTPSLLILGFTLDVKLAKWKLPSYTPPPARPAAVAAYGRPGGAHLLGAATSDSNELMPWGYSPSSYQDNWFKSIEGDIAKLQNAITNHANPVLNNDNPPNACRYTRFGSINVDVIFQVLQQFQWNGFESGDYEDKTYAHTGTYSFSISAIGSYTWQFAAGPVPFFITVRLGLTVGLSYTHKSTRETIELSDGHTAIDTDHAIEVENQALAINFGVMFVVSGGMGVAGVASLGLSASICFNPSLIFFEDGWKEKPKPHTILPVTLRVEAVIQAVFFKWSCTLFQWKGSHDNWKDDADYELEGEDAWKVLDPSVDSDACQPRFLLTHPGESRKRFTMAVTEDGRMLAMNGEDPYLNAVPVDADMMGYSLEARGEKRTADEEVRYIATACNDTLPVLVARGGRVSVELRHASGHHTFVFDRTLPDVEGAIDAETLNDEVSAANGRDVRRAAYHGLGTRVGTEYTYDYSAYNKTTRNPCGPGDVQDNVAPSGGIMPTEDIPIYEGVFSDARIKVVEIAGLTYQFRISTIEYNVGQPEFCRRGRLTASKYNGERHVWEDPIILEYSTGDPDHKRLDLCDYDYDVVTHTQGDSWVQDIEACVVLVSGKMGDTFYDSAANQLVIVLLLDKDLNVAQRAMVTAEDLFGDGLYHTIMSPRIADGFGLNATSGALGLTLVDRASKERTCLMDPSRSEARLVMGQCFCASGVLSLDFRCRLDESDPNSGFFKLDSSVTEAVISASGNNSAGWMRVIAKSGSCYEGWSAYMPSGVAFSECTIMRNVPATRETLPNIQPWSTRGTFLYVRDRSDTSPEGNQNDYYLYEGTYDIDKTGETLSERRVDTAALKSTSFCVSPNGKWLFYFESYRGDPDTAKKPEVENPDPSMVIRDNPDLGLDLYRMMCSYLVNENFSEDFVFCVLDHPVDHFAVAGTYDQGIGSFSNNEACVFMTLEITDADKSVGTIRYLAVPYVAAVELKALTPTDDFVIAGQPANFQIDVFNHGNIIVTGFTVTMHDQDSGVDLTYVVDSIEPNDIRVNSSNGRWADSLRLTTGGSDGETFSAQAESSDGVSFDTLLGITDEMKNGWLMPSTLMSYEITYDIPIDWHDKRTVTMKLTDYKYVSVNEVLEAPPAAIVRNLYLGDTASADFGLFDYEASGSNSIYLPATYYDDEPGPGPTPGPTPGPSPIPPGGGGTWPSGRGYAPGGWGPSGSWYAPGGSVAPGSGGGTSGGSVAPGSGGSTPGTTTPVTGGVASGVGATPGSQTPSGGTTAAASGASGAGAGTPVGGTSLVADAQGVPRTGDVTSAVGAVATALAGFGALFAAYSRRRTRVESDQTDD